MESLAGANALAYFGSFSATKKESFIRSTPERDVHLAGDDGGRRRRQNTRQLLLLHGGIERAVENRLVKKIAIRWLNVFWAKTFGRKPFDRLAFS
jgi:hypothetical protein